MQFPDLQHILDSYSSTLLGKYPHRYLVFDLTSPNNHSLADMLLQDGYWDFAPSRSSRLVGYHQIVAFYCRRHPPHGGDSVEVHHIDGNTTNNLPHNLMYLSPGDHALVTKYQRRIGKLSVKSFHKVSKGMQHTPFNRRGRPIHNWARFILVTIAITVRYTQGWVRSFTDLAYHRLLKPILGYINHIQKVLLSLAPTDPIPV